MTADNRTYVNLWDRIAHMLATLNASQGEIPHPSDLDKSQAKNILDAIWPEIEAMVEDHEAAEKHRAEQRERDDPTDIHFPHGTPEHVIHEHLRTAHANRAPWGYAFSDERPNEKPPRIYGVHRWCHAADGTMDHGQ